MNSREETTSYRNFCRTCGVYFEAFKYVMCLSCQPKIELYDPQQVLRSKLGDNLDVINFKTERLVKDGDNFGSTITKVTIVIKRNNTIETLHLVAKMLPPSRLMRKLYDSAFTVDKEIFLYDQVIPAYEWLYQTELDIVPKFYGGRSTHVKPDESCIDEGAVVLLENLNESGYMMVNRSTGLNMIHMKHVIPIMAKFHAIGLAMKHKNLEFYAKIKRYAKPIALPEDVLGIVVPEILRIVKQCSQLKKYHERVRQLTNKSGENLNCLMQIVLEPDDPWACLVHRDLWKNNMMFHQQRDEIIGSKIFDFQNYCLSSPMTDLIYFLFTSMERDFVHFDEVVELYRLCVREILTELDCDTSLFDRESFDRRLKRDAQSEIFHSILTAKAVEMHSMWEILKVNENFEHRIGRILEIYEEKEWF